MKTSEKQTTHPAKGEQVAPSMRAAVSMSNFSSEEIRRAKNAGCPAFRGHRVYLEELHEWAKVNAAAIRESVIERLEREAKEIKQAAAKFEHDLKRGDYIERTFADSSIVRLERETKSRLSRFLLTELPSKADNLSRAEIREITAGEFERVVEQRRTMFSALGIDYPED